ncbi:MAG TPA: hypothetical protein QGF58_00575 [Myxococcota bacterium]|nr:hypothetical protein [Myxococcota bacterium]
MSGAWTVIDEQAGLYDCQRLEDDVCVLRATALRLADGTFCVVSPIRGTAEEGHGWLEERGGVSVLLAPNHFHNLGLPSFSERHGAEVVARSPRVARLTGLETRTVEFLAERLPPHARALSIPGSRTGEVWLSIQTSRGLAWVVGDAFSYVPRTPNTFLGLMFWALRYSPGLCIGNSFKWYALDDRRAYRDWLHERLATDAPALLVPAHGDVTELQTGALAALTTARLGAPAG